MIQAFFQVDFIPESGSTVRLVSAGDLAGDLPDFPVGQATETYQSLGLDWGGAAGMGGARRNLSFSWLTEHASHAAAAAYAIRWPAAFPFRKAGKIRVAITGGETWDLLGAAVSNISCRPTAEGTFATWTTLQATVGEAVPVSGLAHYAGIFIGWTLETHGAIARTHAAS